MSAGQHPPSGTTIGAILQERALIHPDRLFLVDGRSERTWAEVFESARQLAAALAARGLTPQDRLACLVVHSQQTWELLLGCALAGVVPVLLNSRLSVPELDVIIRDSGARRLIYSDVFSDLASAVKAISPQLVVQDLAEASEGGSDELPELPVIGADSDLVQLYTSGTTGLPKGVRTTHRNMIELLQSVSTEVPAIEPDSVHLVVAPPFHIAGYGYALVALYTGATNILLPQFDPGAVLEAIEERSCTNALLVPAMLQQVLDHPASETKDLSSLRSVLYGGSPASEGLIRRAIKVTHADLTQAYGLTETTGFATLLRSDAHQAGIDAPEGSAEAERLGSAGTPVLGTEVRVVDSSGEEVAEEVRGEVVVRGPLVMAGYWNRPDTDGEVIRDDGFFRTGDVGYFRGGYLFLVDRLNDKIVTKGENVYPGEIERVLCEVPGVLEVAVVGVPDEEYGELLCAVMCTEPGHVLKLRQIQDACRQDLAGFKIPRRLELSQSALPRTPSGKIQRRIVRERFWESSDRYVN